MNWVVVSEGWMEAYQLVILEHLQWKYGIQVSAVAYKSVRCSASCPPWLYTDVDGLCDKMVTDDSHQFTALTVYINW